jgi:3-oxoacyl-[acyl-carrier-protein] synthase-3
VTGSVCLSALAVYLPDEVVTAADIAAASGLPAEVITDKLGLRQKRVAAPDEHVSTLSLAAAQQLLPMADPGAASALIYFGSSIKDFDLWSCAVALQAGLHLANAYAFELASNCAGFGVAVQVGRALLLTDPHLDEVWLVGASKESSVVDYGDLSTKSVFAFGDGAAAALMRRGQSGLTVLATVVVSDGTYNEAVLVPAGGTRTPASTQSLASGQHKVRVQPDLQLGQTIGPLFVELMTRAGITAIDRAGLLPQDIDVVLLQHQIPSVVDAIITRTGTVNASTVELGDYGHMSSIDVPLALHLALQRSAVPAGGHALLLSAGLGYTWTATVLRHDAALAS